MSEQTANLCTTDACESLRARLAKYEDAEGRAVAVLPDHERAKLVNALRDCAKTYAGTGQLRAQIATVLGEFIPLNSSPVSAVCDTCHGQGEVWTGENQSFGYMSMQPPEPIMEACPECSGELVRPASAGDDRKLSDIGNELHNLSCHVVHHNEGWANQLGKLASELWNWQARAALTACAPNHGEQVRQMVPEGFRVMKPTSAVVRDGDRWEIYAPCGSGGIVHEDDVTDWVVRKLLDAAATPSAGSQEQGE